MFKLLFIIILLLTQCFDYKQYMYDYNVMIYIAADNDLDDYADYVISKMSLGITNKNPSISFSVFCDGRYKKYGSLKSTCNYFELCNDGMRVTEDLGELDSSSVNQFKKYIDKFAKPSAKNILIFWGHSSGLPVFEDSEDKYLNDDSAVNTNGYMTREDILNCVKYTYEKVGKIDFVGLDVCSLMYAEMVYDLKEYVHYVGGSQDKQNAFSWNYRSVVEFINNSSSESIENLIKWLVASFGIFYDYEFNQIPLIKEEGKKRGNDTFSVVDLTKIEKFKTKFLNFITSFGQNSAYLNNTNRLAEDVINLAIKLSKIPSSDTAIDIYEFIHRLSLHVLKKHNIDEYNNQINEVLESLDELVVASYSRIDRLATKGNKPIGISIKNVLPYPTSEYVEYDFDHEKIWESFLQSLANRFPGTYLR